MDTEPEKQHAGGSKDSPPLRPTAMVDAGEVDRFGLSYGAGATYVKDENGKILAWNDPRTAKIRSKTFPGIARAISLQWAGNIKEQQ